MGVVFSVLFISDGHPIRERTETVNGFVAASGNSRQTAWSN